MDQPAQNRAAHPIDRPLFAAIRNGLTARCPRCGRAPLYRAYLKPHDRCGACGLAFSGHRADDLPPYLTILIAGHLLIPGVLFVERSFAPPLLLGFALWSALAVALCLALLPAVKGAVIGLQWAHAMHGFDDAAEAAAADRVADPMADRG